MKAEVIDPILEAAGKAGYEQAMIQYGQEPSGLYAWENQPAKVRSDWREVALAIIGVWREKT